MNIIKRCSLMLIIILIMIGVCGCMETNNVETKAEQIKAEALTYLNSNYSDTFTAKLYSASGWAYEYESITFTSEKYPENIVEVRAYKDEDDKYRFIDNYYHCYMQESAEKYVKSLVSIENVVVKISFQNTVWSDELQGAKSFEEWQKKGTADADFYIITKEELSTELRMEMISKLVNDNVSGDIVFIVTRDENFLEEKSLDEILNNQKKYIESKIEYDIDDYYKN